MNNKLTEQDIARLWSQTYNQAGRPDWAHIFPYYHTDIVFEDSIQRVEGKQDFIAMCNRLTERSGNLRMDILTVALKDNTAFLEWVMYIAFKKFPETPMYGTTKLTFAEDNRIIHQRDYYDLWGDIFNGIPGFNKRYRKFVKKYFG